MPKKNYASKRGAEPIRPYFKLLKHVFDTPEFDSLTAAETKLLIQMCAKHSGKNNGDISISWTTMKERGWRSKGTLFRAQRGLELKGWIEVTRVGGRNQCTLYALSWMPIDDIKTKTGVSKLDVSPTIVASNAWKN